ncbi:MAG: glycosyltransferase family 2 protein [Clostridiales bacterium]|nr:glycosyltransferase family 2 protein [Clostridiales bacterium]
MMKKKISFVIPCYGSQKTLNDVVVELIATIQQRKEQYEYEIILVNDFSPDKVWDVITDLAKKNRNIKGISFSRNFGQHAALLAGYGQATGDIVISMDDDGQAPVESIYDLVDKLEEGYDVVYGRYEQMKQNWFRIFGSIVNEKMEEVLLGKPKDLRGTSFFAMKRFVVDEIIRYKNSYPYIGGLVFRTTKNIGNVTVKQRERQDGKSGYTLKKLLKLWINGFTAFSEKPLRLATILGLVCAAGGFLYGIVTVIHKILNPQIQMGYSSILSVILFIGGVIMFLLGMIGEYIGRIYISINDAPQFVIKETTEDKIND